MTEVLKSIELKRFAFFPRMHVYDKQHMLFNEISTAQSSSARKRTNYNKQLECANVPNNFEAPVLPNDMEILLRELEIELIFRNCI